MTELWRVKYSLQRLILMQCIHDLQSPLSASSGYLELMQLTIQGDRDTAKISRYTNSIQTGMEQISLILKQIGAVLNENTVMEDVAQIEVDLHWLLGEICSNAVSHTLKNNQSLEYVGETGNLHIFTDMSLLTLLLYTIIINLSKYSSKNSCIQIHATHSQNNAVIECRSDGTMRTAAGILDAILYDGTENSNTDDPEEHSSLFFPVKEALTLFNAKLTADAVNNREVRLLLTLPLQPGAVQ